MSAPVSETVAIRTPDGGSVTICSFCTVDQIRGYKFDAQFSVHAQYKSLYTKRSSLEACAVLADAHVTVALAAGDRIVGFGVLVPPEPDERRPRPGHEEDRRPEEADDHLHESGG